MIAHKALGYHSRVMSEQKRIMILGNYSAAFAGNREAVNAYTGEIFTNGAGSLDELNCDSDLKYNYSQAKRIKSVSIF